MLQAGRLGWLSVSQYTGIVAGRAAEGRVVSQYNLEYCGRREGCLCRKTGSRRARGRAGRAWARWAREGLSVQAATGARGAQQERGHGVGARGARRQQAAFAGGTGVLALGAGVGAGAWPGRACARRLGVLAGQLGQVGALCTWLSFDSVFDPV